MRFFNTVGPCEPHLHYMLSSLPRLTALRVLIERQHYVVLHAPPQSGKTTLLRVLARTLTDEGEHAAVLLSTERAAAAPLDDLGAAEQVLLCAWREAATAHLPAALQPPPWPDAPPGDRIGAALWRWARACRHHTRGGATQARGVLLAGAATVRGGRGGRGVRHRHLLGGCLIDTYIELKNQRLFQKTHCHRRGQRRAHQPVSPCRGGPQACFARSPHSRDAARIRPAPNPIEKVSTRIPAQRATRKCPQGRRFTC